MAKLTKSNFYAINRLIRAAKADGTYNAEQIAKQANVSTTTVRTIARCKTFPEFERFKRARRLKVRHREAKVVHKNLSLSDPDLKLEETPIERTIAADEPVTRLDIDSLIERVEALENWRKQRLDVEKGLLELQKADMELHRSVSTASRTERVKRRWRELVARRGRW